MRDWTHESLVEDLARTRWEAGDIAASEVSLGAWGDGGQVDVASIRPSWTKPTPTVWEVKASRSDYLSDTRSEKWRKYVPFCRRIYFATPRNLIEKEEVPDGVGLCYRNENGWYTVKAPHLQAPDHDLKYALGMALVMKLFPAPWQVPHPDRYERVRRLADGRFDTKALGQKVAGMIASRRGLRREVDRYEDLKAKLREETPARLHFSGTDMVNWLVRQAREPGAA